MSYFSNETSYHIAHKTRLLPFFTNELLHDVLEIVLSIVQYMDSGFRTLKV